MILRRPATTFLSGESSVDLNSNGRRRYSFVAADLIGGVSRSKILSLYTSYIDTRTVYSEEGSHDTLIVLISGLCGSTEGLVRRRRGVGGGAPYCSPFSDEVLASFFRCTEAVASMKCFVGELGFLDVLTAFGSIGSRKASGVRPDCAIPRSKACACRVLLLVGVCTIRTLIKLANGPGMSSSSLTEQTSSDGTKEIQEGLVGDRTIIGVGALELNLEGADISA